MSTSEKSSSKAIITGLVFIGIIALVLLFLFSSKSRSLYVVNHTPTAMTVKLSTNESIDLEPNEWVEADIDQEPQSLSLFQAGDSIKSIELNPQDFSKDDSGVLIYNIEAAGVFVWEEIVYSEDPDIRDTFEGEWRISTDEEIIYFESADYIFEESPEEIYSNSFGDYEVKKELSFLDWAPMEVSDWIAVAVDDSTVDATLKYMEKQIALGHDDPLFVEDYCDYAESNDEQDRVSDILGEFGWSQLPWIYISHSDDDEKWGVPFKNLEENLATVVSPDEIVVEERDARFVINFPLDTTYFFDVQSRDGQFTRADLIQEIGAVYSRIYDQEAETSTIEETRGFDEETGYRRNETNGKYGIYGFHLEDLLVSGFSQLKHGETLYVIPWVYEDY
jgi:hypothetical protein